MTGEFNLISKYFVARQSNRKDVLLAAGDDCAIVQAPENVAIAISTDTLVEGTHFLKCADPAWVAYKALASNISDLAAMGATPAWVSLALTMPEINEVWLEPFCQAFFELADYYDIQLVGGDTTKGPLAISLTIQGFVPKEGALKRCGAKVGDWIYVTGNLGDSQAGLDVILDAEKRIRPYADELEKRHFISSPRVLVGQALQGVATSAIDISDGLISDLGHILKSSDVGASLDVSQLPISNELTTFLANEELAQQYALSSGEEYELCFTLGSEHKSTLHNLLAHTGTPVTCIGMIKPKGQLELHNNGQRLDWDLSGFDHFKG